MNRRRERSQLHHDELIANWIMRAAIIGLVVWIAGAFCYLI